MARDRVEDRERVVRRHHEREARERVDGHRSHEEHHAQPRVQRPWPVLDPEDVTEEQVPDDDEGDLLEVVGPLVAHREVHDPAQVRRGDEAGVEGEAEHRVEHDAADRAVDEAPDEPLGRAAQRRRGEVERRGGGEQRGRDHDEQEVLNHVVGEQHHVVDAEDRLGREERDDDAQDERCGPRSRPPRDSRDAHEVEGERGDEQHAGHPPEVPHPQVRPVEWRRDRSHVHPIKVDPGDGGLTRV